MKKGLSSLVLIGIIVIAVAAIGTAIFSALKFQQIKLSEEIQPSPPSPTKTHQ